MDDLENRKAFLRYYRMPEETFDKLVWLLAPHLEKNAHMARACVVWTVVHVLVTAVPHFYQCVKFDFDDVALYSNIRVAS